VRHLSFEGKNASDTNIFLTVGGRFFSMAGKFSPWTSNELNWRARSWAVER